MYRLAPNHQLMNYIHSMKWLFFYIKHLFFMPYFMATSGHLFEKCYDILGLTLVLLKIE